MIVNRVSTNNTLDFINNYDGTNNMRYISGPDKDQYNAINRALRISKG